MDEHLSHGRLSDPFSAHSGHLRLTVRLTPGARQDRIDGVETTADGESMLKASVTAVADGGKANKALIELLAKALRHPKSTISIISGATSRKKILRIDGDPEDLALRVAGLLRP